MLSFSHYATDLITSSEEIYFDECVRNSCVLVDRTEGKRDHHRGGEGHRPPQRQPAAGNGPRQDRAAGSARGHTAQSHHGHRRPGLTRGGQPGASGHRASRPLQDDGGQAAPLAAAATGGGAGDLASEERSRDGQVLVEGRAGQCDSHGGVCGEVQLSLTAAGGGPHGSGGHIICLEDAGPHGGITARHLELAIDWKCRCSGGMNFARPMTCLVFSSQFHLETLAPVVDSGIHFDMNSSGVWYSRLEWGRTAL